nr:sulfotransferase domain-containing protein [Roseovarius aestuariivivens]
MFISGPPRSGTTWMLEVLENKLNARRHWEPVKGIQAKWPPVDAYVGGLRPHITSPTDNKKLQDALFHFFAEGAPFDMTRARAPYMSRTKNFLRLASADLTILKFTAAQRLLPFILSNLSTQGIIILRNPLSIIGSVKMAGKREEGWGERIVEQSLDDSILELYPNTPLLHEKHITTFDQLVIRVILDTVTPVFDPLCKEVGIFLPYEEAYEDPTLFDVAVERLGLSHISLGQAEVSRPSATTRDEKGLLGGQIVNRSWNDRLETHEIDRALEIMEAFGLSFYDDAKDCKINTLRKIGLKNLIVRGI